MDLAAHPSGRGFVEAIPSVQHYKHSLLSPDFPIPSSFFSLMNDSCINNGKNNTLQL